MPEGSDPELLTGIPDMTRERILPTEIEGVAPIENGLVERVLEQARKGRELLPIAGGAGFLYDKPEDLEAISNPDLKRIVGATEAMFATATGRVAADGLARVHGRISDLVLDGRIAPEDAQDFLIRINRRVESLDRSGAVDPDQIARQIGASVGEHVSNVVDQIETAQQRAADQITARIDSSARSARSDNQVNREQFESSLRVILAQQDRMFQNLQRGRMSQEQFEQQAQPNVSQLVELFGRSNPEQERERWAQQEYNQDFYARFQPNQEPGFYSKLKPAEREVYDARWQLARAAFIKRMQSSNPKELVGNQELVNLKSEQMELLYNIPGVRPALEWYADFIFNSKAIYSKDKGRPVNIWDVRNKKDFEEIRREMRKEVLGDIEGRMIEIGGNGGEVLGRIEADAVAWNIIYCTNLVESSDSRYSRSGGREGDLPGFLLSDDLRAVFHTQEKFEDKCASGQDWGVFGKWGITQVNRILNDAGVNRKDVNIKFVAAKNVGEFWNYRVVNNSGIDAQGRRLKNDVVVRVPECYPTITTKSFLERWSSGGADLLTKLVNKNSVNWKDVPSDAWGIYNFVNVNKAFKLSGFFSEGVPLDLAKGNEREWAKEFLDCITRLRLEETLTENQLHNLKVWAVYGGLGGVDMPNSVNPTLRNVGKNKYDLSVLLRKASVGFLRESRGFGPFFGESLDLKY